MKSESIIRDGYKGKVRYYEEWVDKGKGTTRFRHCCRRNDVPKKDQWGTYDSWEDAERGAAQIEVERLSRREDQSDPAVIRAIQRGIINTKANAHNAEDLLEGGVALMEFMDDLNAFGKSKGEQPLPSSRVYLSELKTKIKAEIEAKTKKEETTRYSEIIDEFIEWKTGPNGGRGNRPLQTGSKDEWKRLVGDYVSSWIGQYIVTTDKKEIKKAVIDGINNGKVKNNGERKGEPWQPAQKLRCAEKAEQFGNWALKEELITVNPMAGLSGEFAFENDTEVQVFATAEVQKVFNAAVKLHDGKMIPYFAFLFFSTVRPEELSDFKRADEKFFWKNLHGWRHDQRYLGVIGGLEFTVPKWEMINGVKTQRSKVKTRQAFLTPTGMAWLRWYFEREQKGLPNDGQIFASRRYREDIRKEAGIVGGWPQDHARHSLCSYGYYHAEFRKHLSDDDWLRASGHSKATFKKHYDRPQHQSDCTAYFGVLPPGTESLAAVIEETKREYRSSDSKQSVA
jgi:hypothetical protein